MGGRAGQGEAMKEAGRARRDGGREGGLEVGPGGMSEGQGREGGPGGEGQGGGTWRGTGGGLERAGKGAWWGARRGAGLRDG